MAESVLASIQRRQIEIMVGELLLTSDHFMRLEIAERLRHLIAHADPTLDLTQLSKGAREELEELNLLFEQEYSDIPRRQAGRKVVTYTKHTSIGGAHIRSH